MEFITPTKERVRSSSYPETKLSFEQWARELNVSSNYQPKSTNTTPNQAFDVNKFSKNLKN
jgi:hypothetical protein